MHFFSGNVVKYFFISTTKCFELKLYSIIREKYFLYVSALKVVCFESDWMQINKKTRFQTSNANLLVLLKRKSE
jgi:hypothetical protein